MTFTAHEPSAAWQRIGIEVSQVLENIDPLAFGNFTQLFHDQSRRWFFTGQGRSGLVAEMAAMRFMHLGFETHVLGEATAPAVRNDDGLFIISNSGKTPLSAAFAEIARTEGAMIVLLTAGPGSPLAKLADATLTLASSTSEQFGGSLFEQASLIALDALVLELATNDAATYEKMRRRHTNMQ
ncbi:SIS domain-containing protein [Paenarthrobacter histidinolovorans]|uniref:SIS domain-containing protein n=1 Tax=Paenarthrobacter histidinolovorans TaxID=43664 RepID=UPI00166E6261|nr:SIS domain-containing protein [Paenarthrobacter histidinolovorans]GGJ22281.1 6-phospho 3-hexuloisomerase [Paenarthrobacter histidinolovorans]